MRMAAASVMRRSADGQVAPSGAVHGHKGAAEQIMSNVGNPVNSRSAMQNGRQYAPNADHHRANLERPPCPSPHPNHVAT